MKSYKVILISVLLTAVILMSSCITYTSFDELTTRSHEGTTVYQYYPSAENTTVISIPVETRPAESTTVVTVIPEQTTQGSILLPEATTNSQTTEQTTQAVASRPDYTSYSKKQIIDTYTEALNKTRSYTGKLTVNHSESFDAKIKDAHPGGALTELLADNIVKLVGSEGQQTLNFNGGYAVNADGESVPILLPQRTAFSLPEAGVASAEINKSGDKTAVRLVLVPETVSMGQVPTYNANAIGYLDTSDMDFKIITISRVDITYPGSVIDATIRSDGYIESVTYTINMSTYAELSGMGISGYGTLEGAQTEKWQLNW